MAGDWPVSFPHPLSNAEITLSLQKFCLPFSETDYFHALWNDCPVVLSCVLCLQKMVVSY